MNLSVSGPERSTSWSPRAYRYHQQQLIALLPVTFGSEEEFELHRHLRAIGNNTLLSKLTPPMIWHLPKNSFCHPILSRLSIPIILRWLGTLSD